MKTTTPRRTPRATDRGWTAKIRKLGKGSRIRVKLAQPGDAASLRMTAHRLLGPGNYATCQPRAGVLEIARLA